jgi:hypothetical protein
MFLFVKRFLAHYWAVMFLGVFGKATKTEVSHNEASCRNIKRNCLNGNYEE